MKLSELMFALLDERSVRGRRHRLRRQYRNSIRVDISGWCVHIHSKRRLERVDRIWP
ncbi:MAG: hypothetical protein ACRBN8_44220 [Nannocystales bacterium]